MSDSDLIRRCYDAWSRRDVPSIFALLHPDVEIVQTSDLPWGGHHHGLAGAAHFFKVLSGLTEGQPRPERFIEAGDRVAVTGRIQGKVRETGKKFDLPLVHLWTLQDGLVRRFEAFIDTPGMRDALRP